MRIVNFSRFRSEIKLFDKFKCLTDDGNDRNDITVSKTINVNIMVMTE